MTTNTLCVFDSLSYDAEGIPLEQAGLRNTKNELEMSCSGYFNCCGRQLSPTAR